MDNLEKKILWSDEPIESRGDSGEINEELPVESDPLKLLEELQIKEIEEVQVSLSDDPTAEIYEGISTFEALGLRFYF